MRPEETTAHWLNSRRLVAYSRMLIAIIGVTGVLWLLAAKHLVDPAGSPVGNDYIMLWAASLAALKGHAQDAYNAAYLFRLEQIAVPASSKVFGWFYPPSYFLLILPLAKLPYLAGYALWGGSTLALFVAAMRRMVRGSVALWCLAAYPGIWYNLLDGQNGLLTAAVAGAAIYCLPRRPYVAGVLIGLLCIKPHLGLLFVVALLAAGAWRVMAAAAASAVGLTAAGVLVCGKGTLLAWLGSLGIARMLLELGGISMVKMPTVFAMLRLWGAPVGFAYAAHGGVAVVAAIVVWRVWRRSSDWRLRGAALMAATMVVSPYLYDYDLAWLAFPIAWLCVTGLETGWLRGERELLLAAFVLPLLSTPIASTIAIQVGPFIALALLYTADRHVALARNETASESHALEAATA